MKDLIKKLFKTENFHQEYQDIDVTYILDSLRKDDTLEIKVKVLKNKDREDFENWLKEIDDALFSEILLEIGDIEQVEKLYNSKDYKKAINLVKNATKKIVKEKIEKLKKLC